MKVPREIAWPYSERILRDGKAMAEIVRETVDFDRGHFEATADFVVESPDQWEMAPMEAGQDGSAEPSGKPGFRLGYEEPVREWVYRFLAQPGNAVLREGWHVDDRREVDRAPHRRFWQLPVQDRFEDHLLVEGPTRDKDVVQHAIDWGPPNWCLGVLLRLDGKDLPDHNAVIDEHVLRLLLTDVVGMFMQLAGYDGYLIWRADADPGER